MNELSNDYRAVVALNNMGASLLEQGRCAPAHDTLRDAVCLMKRTFRSSASLVPPGKVDHRDDSDKLHCLMRSANQRYAWSEPMGPTATPTIKVTTLSCRAEPSDLNEVCKSRLPNSFQELYTIRMEAEDCELFSSQCLDKAAVLASFILFHNYAIAIACCAATRIAASSSSSSLEHPLHRNLRSILALCQRVLSTLCLNPNVHGTVRRQLYLEVLMTQTYHSALVLSGLHKEAERLQLTLERLKSSLPQWHENPQDGDDVSGCGGRARKAPAA